MVKAVDPDAVIEDVGVVSINDEDLPEVDLSHADLSDFQDGYYCGFLLLDCGKRTDPICL